MAADSVTLIVGDEELLVDRAIGEIVGPARRADPEVQVVELTPATMEPGRLVELTSPSLFGGGKVIVVRAAQDAGKDLSAELTDYAKSPADDIVLVVVHAGGAKGKALLDGLGKAGVNKLSYPKITKPSDRIQFVRAEVRRAGGSITEGAARTLIDAVGTDLRELASACSQLVSDTGGAIDDETVARYHRGRAEVTGFVVADRAVEGNLAAALEQLRWALSTGVAPVLITSALAQGVRSLAKVGGAPRNLRGAALTKELGLPPWKIDRVRGQLRGWTPDGVARALSVIADTDEQVKGGSADATYALEKAVSEIVAARSIR
ncbi:MAG TPA: DNA polymerase III subunit delta [Streptosporangiaceae bacterium]